MFKNLKASVNFNLELSYSRSIYVKYSANVYSNYIFKCTTATTTTRI